MDRLFKIFYTALVTRSINAKTMKRSAVQFFAALVACGVIPLFVTQAKATDCDSYAEQLSVMTSADQALRGRQDFLRPEDPGQRKLIDHIALVDRTNTARLKALVTRCGWPTKGGQGAKTVRDAWLVVQHANHDVAFQKRALAMIEQAAEAGEAAPSNVAYLADRIAVAENRPQPYGTQLRSKSMPCDLEFAPMDDREKVEARRKTLGLPTLDQYRELVMVMRHCQQSKSLAELKRAHQHLLETMRCLQGKTYPDDINVCGVRSFGNETKQGDVFVVEGINFQLTKTK